MTLKAYVRPRRRPASRPIDITRRAPPRTTCRSTSIQRRVSLGPASGARGMGRHVYPFVPGHEIIGRVSRRRGSEGAQSGRPGGRRCIVPTLQHCADCNEGWRTTATNVGTYTPPRRTRRPYARRYSQRIVVQQHYVSGRTSEAQGRGGASPMCGHHHLVSSAPLKVGPARSGRGRHRAWATRGIKLARAMGAHVVAFTTTGIQREDASCWARTKPSSRAMPTRCAAHAKSLEFILNTVAARTSDALIVLLKRDGRWCSWGRRPRRIPRRRCST